MKSTVEKLGKNQVALEVEVAEERVEKALDEASRKVARQVRIPGFRPGRAPRRVIEMRLGPEVLYQEALEELVPEAYVQALRDNDLTPIDNPDFDILEMEVGRPLRFKATVELKPEVTLGEYKGLEATKQTKRVTNDDVDRVLEEMREQNAQLVDSEKEGIETGDFVVIDFTGYVDDQPFPGGAAEGYTLEIGRGYFIPGFEEQLIGAKLKETRQVVVTFPEDYQHSQLAGQEARFDVKIQAIKEKSYPALNDDFAKDVGDFETLLELRADIRQRLEETAGQIAERQLEDDLMKQIAQRSSVDIPNIMIERQMDQKRQRMERELQYSGLTVDQYMEIMDLAEEELEAKWRTEAEAEVKLALVLEALVAAENISVSDEELEEYIKELAGDGPNSALRQAHLESQKEGLQDQLAGEKAVEVIKANARITEVTVDEPEVGSEAVADEVTEDASTDEDMAIEDGSEEKDVK
ncbi:MAG: trigger factor [Firmicutes bacterium]|jgi:trigger factor|nr:trigger factor [Bacillota bacterium]